MTLLSCPILCYMNENKSKNKQKTWAKRLMLHKIRTLIHPDKSYLLLQCLFSLQMYLCFSIAGDFSIIYCSIYGMCRSFICQSKKMADVFPAIFVKDAVSHDLLPLRAGSANSRRLSSFRHQQVGRKQFYQWIEERNENKQFPGTTYSK